MPGWNELEHGSPDPDSGKGELANGYFRFVLWVLVGLVAAIAVLGLWTWLAG